MNQNLQIPDFLVNLIGRMAIERHLSEMNIAREVQGLKVIIDQRDKRIAELEAGDAGAAIAAAESAPAD